MTSEGDLPGKVLDAAARFRGDAQRPSPLSGSGGGGTSDGVDDGWKKSVEDQLKRNADDLRALLRGVIAAGLVIVGMIVGLYAYTGMKSDALGNQIAAARVDQEKLRGAAETADARINGKLDRITDRLPK